MVGHHLLAELLHVVARSLFRGQLSELDFGDAALQSRPNKFLVLHHRSR